MTGADGSIQELDVELPTRPVEKKWDPEPSREKLRGILAGSLVAILAAVIAAAWWTIWQRFATPEEVKDFLAVVLSPVVALVGSAIGFYFGGKTSAR